MIVFIVLCSFSFSSCWVLLLFSLSIYLSFYTVYLSLSLFEIFIYVYLLLFNQVYSSYIQFY